MKNSCVNDGTDTFRGVLQCTYYERGECRSCTLIEIPYQHQVAQKTARVSQLLPVRAWCDPAVSEISGFRNKVKLVVSGSAAAPKLGIANQDLRECPLPTSGIRAAIPVLAQFVTRCELTPYRFETNTGVLKFIIVTESARGELMVRFVVRRRGVRGIIFKYYSWLEANLPQLRVCSINVQPERKAIIEGAEEIIVSKRNELQMPLTVGINSHSEKLLLSLQPKSFFQTNTQMAQALYARAAGWIYDYLAAHLMNIDGEIGTCSASHKPIEIWDLYCGVGGFALAAAVAVKAAETGKGAAGVDPGADKGRKNLASRVLVRGVEVSEHAVAAANKSARQQNLPAEFVAGDAVQWAREQLAQGAQPSIVVVNPPRRGIGKELARMLNRSGAARIIYSSCNPESLAADLAQMPAYQADQAQLVDIFPHTNHVETVVLLSQT